MLFYSIILSINIAVVLCDTKCTCKVGGLDEIEKLNKDLKRIRVEYPNGLNKYPDNQLSYNSYVDCDSMVLYEIVSDRFKGVVNKKCRTCTRNGWSEIDACKVLRCDRDNLIGQPVIQVILNAYIFIFFKTQLFIFI